MSVNLSERQYEALRSFADDLDTTMGGYLRALALPTIPPDYWKPEPPTTPGQMTLDEAGR